jgi:hypothetical protein
MESEISRLTLIQQQNREDVQKIKQYENKIQNVDATRMLLDNLSTGTGVMTSQMEKLSKFTQAKDSLWLSNLTYGQAQNLKLEGYTLSRPIVRLLSDSYDFATLQNIIFDPIKEMRSFKFLIDAGKIVKGNMNNEQKN